MGRTLGMLLFAVSLTAVAQVTVQGGYATQTPTTTPILAPPNAALSGSGTPTGAPLDINANNARLNATGAIYTPDTQVNAGSTGVSGAAPSSAAATNSQAATPPRAFGVMTRFIPDQSRPSAISASQIPSLGEIAARYRGNKAAAGDRRLDNTDVLALNNTATFRGQTVELPQSDQPPVDENGNVIGAPRANGQQGDQQVLDQNDLRDVENAVQRSKERQKQQAPPPQEQPR
jgi:hypothetical protein